MAASHAIMTVFNVEIDQLAIKVFGNETSAHQWLDEQNLALDNMRPNELLATSDGAERVRTLLLQIEYGVLA